MPIHDWRRVEDGIFHDFHVAWLPELRKVLNNGLLPDGYYALAEQHAGRSIADVLTLHASPEASEPLPLPPASGGVALAESLPRVRHRQTLDPNPLSRRRTLAIRHVSGHRLIALLEVLSPANKDRPRHVSDFAAKIASALAFGVHALVIDLLPPGPHDPMGIHERILNEIDGEAEAYALSASEPLTFASYAAGPMVDVFLEHAAVGGALPDMPLFLRPDRYVNVPLEATYQAAFEGMPRFYRDILTRPVLPSDRA